MAEDLSRIVPRPASGKPQPADPNAGTWRDPRQYDPEFLSQVGGEAIVDVYEGLAQMPEQVYKVFRGFMERQRQKSPEGLRGTADPYDTAAYDAAVLALEGAAKEPVKTAKSAAKANRAMTAGNAPMSPFLMRWKCRQSLTAFLSLCRIERCNPLFSPSSGSKTVLTTV